MSFVLFFRGMLAALLIFAVATYVLTESLWSTIWQTIICAVVLQVGYFIGVLWLVWRADNRPAASVAQEEGGPWERPSKIVSDTAKLPGTSFSHRP